jgi:hypothetical protein
LSGENLSMRKCARCPKCETYLAADDSDSKAYRCVMCGQSATLIGEEDCIGSFVLGQPPKKKTINTTEVLCCGNCDNSSQLGWNSGSILLCKVHNSLNRSFNKCDGYWLPRNPERYMSDLNEMLEHIHSGQYNSYNTRELPTIENIELTKEDIDRQWEEIKNKTGAYMVAYESFRSRLREKALEAEVENLDEVQKG